MFNMLLLVGVIDLMTVWGARLDRGGNGEVHIVSLNGVEVVKKCGPVTMVEQYTNEYSTMELLRVEPWAVEPFEFFVSAGRPCILMELLGDDLAKIRSSNSSVWPIETVVSIGISLIDALKELHFRFGLAHTDLHSGNIAVRKNDSSKLVIFDYGDMVSVGGHNSLRSADLIQAILSLRYYWDGDRKYYVAKRYSYNKEELCEGIPESLCDVIDYVYKRRKGKFGISDYDRVRSMLVGILDDGGFEWDGGIIWGI